MALREQPTPTPAPSWVEESTGTFRPPSAFATTWQEQMHNPGLPLESMDRLLSAFLRCMHTPASQDLKEARGAGRTAARHSHTATATGRAHYQSNTVRWRLEQPTRHMHTYCAAPLAPARLCTQPCGRCERRMPCPTQAGPEQAPGPG